LSNTTHIVDIYKSDALINTFIQNE